MQQVSTANSLLIRIVVVLVVVRGDADGSGVVLEVKKLIILV